MLHVYCHLRTKRKTNSSSCRCVNEILTVVSMLSSDNLFIQPHGESEKKVVVCTFKCLSLIPDFLRRRNRPQEKRI